VIICLVGSDPSGRLVRGAGGELEATDEDREAHGRLIHSPPLPESVGSPSDEARCGASCSSKG